MTSELIDKQLVDDDPDVEELLILNNDSLHRRHPSPNRSQQAWRHVHVSDVSSEYVLSPDPNGDADLCKLVGSDLKHKPVPLWTKKRVSISSILWLGLLVRIIMLVICIAQDATRWPDGQLRFTDIDYDVFTDAAKAMIAGKDLYEARPTYRYSPLIAAIVAPGYWLFGNPDQTSKTVDDTNSEFFDPPLSTLNLSAHHILKIPHYADNVGDLLASLWGKCVFIMADLLCAFLQYKIILSYVERSKSTESSHETTSKLAIFLISFTWLFNPVTAIVSVRGNAEAVLGACVLGCLFSLLRQRVILSGLLFGLCIHLKLYPIIYAPAIYLWLSNWSMSKSLSIKEHIKQIIPRKSHFCFGLATISSLASLTAVAYTFFGGMRFLHQAYFYHFTRVDVKHNFAPHFYPLYLLNGLQWRMLGFDPSYEQSTQGQYSKLLFDRLHTAISGVSSGNKPAGGWEVLLNKIVAEHATSISHLFNLFSLLPSAILVPVLAFKLHQYPGLCWFATTYAFVTFNKVCTSQYFLWSLVLLPLALAHLKLPSSLSIPRAVIENLFLWFGAQGLWLGAAYVLEMRTPQSALVARWVWIAIWLASLLFVATNVLILRRLLGWRRMPSAQTVSDKKTQ